MAHDDDLQELVRRFALPPAVEAALVELWRTAAGGAAGTWAEGDDTAEAIALVDEGARYASLALLGAGGMGVVRRVRDQRLQRVVALKTLQPELARDRSAAARFVREAEITAQLEHPGIVPVHDLGTLPDGRPYYTMKEVRGRTFGEVMDEPRADARTRLRHLVGVLHRACEAVAYAHARGVVHRDLKPDNVMVGAYGEVLVLDWGIARIDAAEEAATPSVTSGSPGATRVGAVVGTEGYMSPEQARGERVDARADVWALGVLLSEILIRCGVAEPTLAALDRRCLAEDREARPADAGVVAREIGAWLDGAARRAEGLQLVEEADRLAGEIGHARASAADLRARAAAALEGVKPSDPAERKRPAWALEQEAERTEREVEILEGRWMEVLQAALRAEPDLVEAHDRLADHWHRRAARAEAAREASGGRYEALLRAHDRSGRHASWLAGRGILEVTGPAGTEVELLRFEAVDRRLLPTPVEERLRVPFRRELPHGGWLLRVHGAPVRVPVHLPRGEERRQVALGAAPEDLGEDDVLVPGGPFLAGGDPKGGGRVREEVLPSFVIRRFPVTNREYLVFLDDLVARGREEEALAHAPRERTAAGPSIYGRGEDGRFRLVPDPDGDLWDADWPVLMVDRTAAAAYAAWLAERTGLPWRLPTALEWEKAARGTDGRFFPWGQQPEPSYACNRESHAGRPLPCRVTDFPVDESPYGVRGLAGNARDWCADLNERGEGCYAGGSWNGPAWTSHCGYLVWGPPTLRFGDLSFRVARSG